jgi:SAM-dependent methyltransferase
MMKIRPAEAHYVALLSTRYTWMLGGPEVCLTNARSLLDAAGILSSTSGVALDLGAGGGYHARALAERGFEVLAVDSSTALLAELSEVCKGLSVIPVQGDLLDDSAYRHRAPFELILCVGDTLTHLDTRADVDQVIDKCASLLSPGGKLVLQFREQTADLPPEQSTFTTRSDRNCIMECVLHFQPERVWVTDIVHEWNGQQWHAIRSSYAKLRLTATEIIGRAHASGLKLLSDEPHARQRLLVFKRP